jgi:hypothetical protein
LLIMSLLRKHGVVSAVAAAASDIERRFAPNSLNAILLSPRYLYGISWHNRAKVPEAKLRERGYGGRPADIAAYFDLSYKASPDAVIVASSGWQRAGWTPVPNRHVLVVERGTLSVQLLALPEAKA